VTTILPTRAATAADSPALVAQVNSAFRGDSSKDCWTTEADLLGGQRVDVERIVETIASAHHVVLLHEQDDELVGCVQLECTADDCYLGMLTVRPGLQGAGLGRQLLEAAERWAIAHWSSRSMRMSVIAQRVELIAWYERRGYRLTGERKPFPYGDDRFGLPRRADLVFEIMSKHLLIAESGPVA
jgi:ribosomal protein S18 acetylase RimI-like enzyme